MNNHELNSSTSWGNGGHGHCKHCGLALVTDLGYYSWNGVDCIERKPTAFDLPDDVRSFVYFNGLKYIENKKIFVKPYTDQRYTLTKLLKIVDSLTRK